MPHVQRGGNTLVKEEVYIDNAATIVNAPFHITPSTAPTNAYEGDFYWDDTANAPKYHTGTAFQTIATTTSAQTFDENVTVAASKTLAVTTADKLTVGGVIIPQTIEAHMFVAGGAAAADYDGLFFTADAAYEVTSVVERHSTAGSDAGAVTLMVKKVPSGTAKASGTDILSAGINLKGTADTNASGTLHGTAANYRLAAGDSLGLVTTGTLTAVDGVSVSVWMKRI